MNRAALGSIRSLKPAEFEAIRQLAYEKFGLDLRKGKEELVAVRLGAKIRELGFQSFHEYYQHVVQEPTGDALIGMIDALTTNHTSFLRESAHFEFLKKQVFPAWRERPSIEIWTAACSSGEEPYSLAFTALDEWGPEAYQKVRILATDISTKVLGMAQRGVYPAERFKDFQTAWLRQYLLRGEGQWKGWYRVKPEIRKLIEFDRLNLVEPFPHTRMFSLIFCRNVMIYFDRRTQETLVNRLAERLELGGYLFTGHAESFNGLRHSLEYVAPAIYRRGKSTWEKTK